MLRYDPLKAPDPDTWLEATEAQRIKNVENYHNRADVAVPNLKLHAIAHAAVETQLAHELPDVTAAMKRLLAQGLDRHEILHAIGHVLMALHFDIKNGFIEDADEEEYFRRLGRLTAKKWLNRDEI